MFYLVAVFAIAFVVVSCKKALRSPGTDAQAGHKCAFQAPGAAAAFTEPATRYGVFVCSTEMPLVDGGTLRQTFDVRILGDHMAITLRRRDNTPDHTSEYYRYERMTAARLEGTNARGLTATFDTGALHLSLSMRGEAAPPIAGSCSRG